MCEAFADSSCGVKVAIIGVSVVLFVSFFLIGFSVTIVEPLEYGLAYDVNNMSVDKNKLYTSG